MLFFNIMEFGLFSKYLGIQSVSVQFEVVTRRFSENKVLLNIFKNSQVNTYI